MSTMRTVRLVIFDVGGTIIEDNGEVIASFRAALAASGLAVSDAELRELKGSSKRDVIKKFVERQWGANETGNEDRIRKAYDDFRAELENRFSNGGVKPIPGVESTFRWLKTHNIVCATTTGFYRSVTDTILSSAGWQNTFAANICSDDVKDGRPAPYMIFRAMEAARIDNVRDVLNVGDTPLDLQAGSRAGVLGVIGVLSGVHKKDRLLQESPSHLIRSVADLPFLIEAHYS
jgi:phosphonatase-like hydrolase